MTADELPADFHFGPQAIQAILPFIRLNSAIILELDRLILFHPIEPWE
jgi:hypothetical protein